MKHFTPLLLVLVASCGTTRITGVGGKTDFGHDLTPIEEHTVGGLEVSSGPKGGGFGFEVGARYGRDSGSDAGIGFKSESYEYYGGPRYEWRLGGWSPFLSAGLSELRLRADSSVASSAHDSDLGFYVAAGSDYHFGNGWHLGASLRKTIDHDASPLGVDGDADSWQYLMRLGYAF
jgi:hypothetical protein